MAETPVTLPEMKQQLRVGFYVNGVSVKEPDPRALIFEPVYKPMINGLR